MRLTSEELQNVMKKYKVDKLYSWSKVNCFMTSPYEYFLKYVLHKKEDVDNCAYAPMGGICHSIIERLYKKEIKYEDMIEEFDNGWITAIDIADLKFDRNDSIKNTNIKEKYRSNLHHFFSTHSQIKQNIMIEKFMTSKIGDYVLQGYIDAIYKDDDGFYNIVDWKTSTKYSGKVAEEKCGQLVVYAIGLNQQGIPMDKIKICWNFLKYVSIQYQQKNGAIKTREVERCKIGESLQANAKMWLKAGGYDVDEYLKLLLDTNSIECLPDDVKDKYVISDCYIYVPLTEKLVQKWVTEITTTIQDIELREKDYEETKNDKVFWDSEESVKAQSYYFSTLCSYSPNLHKPYQAYLDSLEAAKNGEDVFTGVGENQVTTKTSEVKHQNKESLNDIDLSWLDEI